MGRTRLLIGWRVAFRQSPVKSDRQDSQVVLRPCSQSDWRLVAVRASAALALNAKGAELTFDITENDVAATHAAQMR
jgi:hypothetical protein